MRCNQLLSITACACLLTVSSLHAETPRPVGVIVALDAHETRLGDQIDNRRTVRRASRSFTQGTLHGDPIVLVNSPMGPIKSTVTATTLVLAFSPRAIVHLAPAGALVTDLSVGELVVVERAVEHDVGTWVDGGFAPRPQPVIPLDRGLMARLDDEELSLRRVTAASGGQFVASRTTRTRLRDDLDTQIVDTSAAAVATVAEATHTPALLLRVITDDAGADARDSFEEIVDDEKVIQTTTQRLVDVLRHLSEAP